jgi:hypothetical protein
MADTKLTNRDLLESQGIVEITNADGSKSQFSKEEAAKRLADLEAFKSSLPRATATELKEMNDAKEDVTEEEGDSDNE